MSKYIREFPPSVVAILDKIAQKRKITKDEVVQRAIGLLEFFEDGMKPDDRVGIVNKEGKLIKEVTGFSD